MSLNWNVAKCPNKADLLASVQAGGITQTIIFETMLVGLGAVTEKNVTEFKMRSDFARTLHGITPLLPLEDLRRHIGLTTNVSDESWPKFSKRMVEGWQREWRWQHREEVAHV